MDLGNVDTGEAYVSVKITMKYAMKSTYKLLTLRWVSCEIYIEITFLVLFTFIKSTSGSFLGSERRKSARIRLLATHSFNFYFKSRISYHVRRGAG